MKKLLSPLCVLAILFLSACSNAEHDKSTQEAAHKDSSTKIQDVTNPAIGEQAAKADSISVTEVSVFTAPNGKTYEFTYMDPNVEEMERGRDAPLNCDAVNFDGHDRKVAKISLSTAATETFANLGDFLATLQRTNDAFMIDHQLISRDENNNRVREEKRNVKISSVFLYAIKREPDNDYHIIIGNGRGVFFNIECSGLPGRNSRDYNRLLTARNQVEDYFGVLCNSKYKVFSAGIPVSVRGSLFYDIDHRPGVVGPEGYKPKTSWEIHPIRSIEFL